MAQPAQDTEVKSSTKPQQPSIKKAVSNQNEQFCVRNLFGGAFQISLPSQFIDLSNFRLVPDHQEVWSDAHRDQSIIVELVEFVEGEKDGDAAKYHFNDIAETSNSMETKIVSSGVFASNTLSVATKYHCSWTFGTQKVSKGRDGTKKANVIALYLVLIRLKQYGTDLLISFNAPIRIHEESQAKSAKNAVQSPEVSLQLFKQIVSTFNIKDLSIFNVEE